MDMQYVNCTVGHPIPMVQTPTQIINSEIIQLTITIIIKIKNNLSFQKIISYTSSVNPRNSLIFITTSMYLSSFSASIN